MRSRLDTSHKSSFKLANAKASIAIFLIVTMLFGFLFSRGVLSIAMILFGVNALWNVHPREWLRQKWWLWGVAWVALFALSFFWSDDKKYWGDHVQVKLPILLLPLAFAFLPSFTKKQLTVYTVAMCSALLIGIGYSFFFLVQDPARYIEGYRFSNVLPTLPRSEHIRFTLLLAIGIIWCFYFYKFVKNRILKGMLIFCLALFIISIHGYAVRTGLLAFYIFIVGYLFYLFSQKKSRLVAGISIVMLVVASYLAFTLIPTLKLRVDHFKWMLMVFEKDKVRPEYGDIGRYISYDIGLKIIKEHPYTGVGAGDMFSEMSEKYKAFYPSIDPHYYLIPHNQFLIVAVAAGIPVTVIFAIWLFYPLGKITRNRNGFFFSITWLILFISILVEPVLEIQFGLFVFIFFLLLQRHCMLQPLKSE